MYKSHYKQNSYGLPSPKTKNDIRSSLINIKKPMTLSNSLAHTRANTAFVTSSNSSAAHKRY